MTDKLKGVLIAAIVVAALVVGGATIAIAQGGGETDEPDEAEENDSDSAAAEAAEAATGRTADQAAKAAVDAVGGGDVLEFEHGDDGMSGYEVEVQKRDGSYVEVNLDRNHDVVSTGGDD